MTDQNDHMSREATAEEAPAIVAQYQQWLADRDLTIATLSVKVAKAHGRLEIEREDHAKAKEQVERLEAELALLRPAGAQKRASTAQPEGLDPV